MKVKLIIGDEKKAQDKLTRVLFDIALRRIKEGKIDFIKDDKNKIRIK